MITFDAEKETLRLAVRDLLAGEDSGPGVYLPGRGQLGTRAHLAWQQRRRQSDPGYRAELFLRTELEVAGIAVILQGRLDGFQPEPQPVVEEIKTTLLPPDQLPAITPAGHPDWFEQLEIYCWLAARELALPQVGGRLILLPVTVEQQSADQRSVAGERIREVQPDLTACETRLTRQLEELIRQQREQARRWQSRRRRRLTFPFSAPRPQQERLMEAVSDAAARHDSLVVQAPTGSGKTAAMLYPALQVALRKDRRLFVVTPKNSGQMSFVELVRLINTATATPVSCVRIPAREKICPAERYICDADYCPFLRDFQAASRRALSRLGGFDIVGEEELRLTAEQYRVCPHELALSLSEERDVVIGDYNHVFAPASQIRRLFRTGQAERLFLLVDEAHNFPARARSWFSIDIDSRDLDRVIQLCQDREAAAAGQPGLFGGVDPNRQLRSAFERFRDLCLEQDCFRTDRWRWQHTVSARFQRDEWEEIALELAQAFMAWLLYHKISGSLLEKDAVASLYYDLQYFCYLAGQTEEGFEHFVEQRRNGFILRILCLKVPQPVRQQLTEFPAVFLFSATLPPASAFTELAGLPPETPRLDLPAVFPARNRLVMIQTAIHTRLRQREASLPELSELVGRVFETGGVNLAVFLPSFDYLQQLRSTLAPQLPLLVQTPGQTNPERAALLQSLRQPEAQLLLAVSGGSLAEGVDLPGRLLEGVIVVGPALPAVSVDNELMRAYYDRREQDGFDYAYRIPGMTQVAQAGGRLIRSERDRGFLILVGPRFLQPEYQRLLPVDIVESAVRCDTNSQVLAQLKQREFSR